MNLQTEIQDGVVITKLEGNLLGETHYQPMVEMVQEQIGQGNNLFILNLEDLKYTNSTGLGGMITMLTKARNSGGELILVNVPDTLKKLIRMTKLDKIFTEASSLDEAKANLKA